MRAVSRGCAWHLSFELVGWLVNVCFCVGVSVCLRMCGQVCRPVSWSASQLVSRFICRSVGQYCLLVSIVREVFKIKLSEMVHFSKLARKIGSSVCVFVSMCRCVFRCVGRCVGWSVDRPVGLSVCWSVCLLQRKHCSGVMSRKHTFSYTHQVNHKSRM